jgi:peptide/nickel transport system substrate-binding protein
MLSKKWALFALVVFVGSILLTACEGETKEVEVTVVVKETVVEKEVQTVVEKETVVETVVEKETVVETVILEPTEPPPPPAEPRTLVICQGQEPDTLYQWGGSMLAARHVQEAIYDGPIDNNTFGYQPVILEKLPSLADGDAVLNAVTVEAGDLVVDDLGDPVTLEEGVLVRPSGCASSDCAIEFAGDPIEMDQMVVTNKFIEGILWSDGEPLTAYDSVYSFELVKDPDTPATKYTADRTASYEATDDYTVVWTGLPGYRDSTYFFQVQNFTPLPEHAWGDFTALELLEAEESSRTPIGWGPYIITEWVAGDHISLVKNENYWRADEGLPPFEEVIFRMVGENSNANIAAILSGECDIVDQTAHLDDQSELLLELQASGQVNATFVTGTVWEHADFGIVPVESYDRPDFFGDVRTRRAIAYCMDRQAVVDTVMFGQSIVLDTYIPPEHPLFNTEVPHYDFDVAAGTALLDEVGWLDDDGDPATPRVASGVEGIPDGTLLEFNYWTTSATQRQQATQVLQASLAECGIKVNLEYWSSGEYFADGPDGPIFGRHFDIGQFAWLTGVEPSCNLFISQEITGPPEEGMCGWGCANDTGWSDEEYDAACNAALQSLPGTPEYEQYHKEAQYIFGDQLPVVPLYLRLKLAATRPDMKNFIMDPTNNSEMWNIEEFDY